jgi:hypothetical protein
MHENVFYKILSKLVLSQFTSTFPNLLQLIIFVTIDAFGGQVVANINGPLATFQRRLLMVKLRASTT